MKPLVRPNTAVDTYRYLRIAIPVLVLMLAAAVLNQVIRTEPDCWLGSISAYYYTSARAVFVACLCAIGAAMIIYRGNARVRPDGSEDNLEDFLLDIAGFLAFIVALVPTPLQDLVIAPDDKLSGTRDAVCERSNVPTETQLTDALNNNVFALLVAASAVLVVLWFLHYLEAPAAARSVLAAVTSTVGTIVLGAAVAILWVLFVLDPSGIRHYAHLGAASAMFLGIVAVVVLNAREASAPYARWYWVISALMGVVIVVLGSLALAEVFDHAVFWLESGVIALFAVFWCVQTAELWDVEQRKDLTAADGAR